MSQASAMFMPAPAAAPLTAAMTGLVAFRIASTTLSLIGVTLSLNASRPPLAVA